MLLAALVLVGWPWLVKCGGLLLIALHAGTRYPSAAPILIARPDGLWAVPERGLAELELDAASRYTTVWVRLILTGRGRALDILLLADQLDRESWCALQARLRRPAPPRSGAPGRARRGDRPADLR